MRIPAAFCSLPGLKPTVGRMASIRDGWGDLTHLGALTASIIDLARYLDVVMDRVGKSVARRDKTSFGEAVQCPLALGKLRVAARLDLHGASVESEVAEAFVECVKQLRYNGISIVELNEPLPESLTAFLDFAAHCDGMLWDRWSERERMELGRGFSAWCQRGFVGGHEILPVDGHETPG